MASDRFYVKNLTLENFRCFEKVELGPFDPHFNLLVGTNGAGKSSVLLALANLFRQLGAPELDGAASKLIGPSDIRFEAGIGVDGVGFQTLHLPTRTTAEFRDAGVDRTASDNLTTTVPPFAQGFREAIVSAKDVWRPGKDAEGAIAAAPLALIAFYTVSRHFRQQVPASPPSLPAYRLSALENWFDAGTNSASLREWIKDQTLIVLQQVYRERESTTNSAVARPFRQLNLITNAITGAVEGADRIHFDADRQDIVVQFQDGSRRDFAGMSDGQRALIGLVADIARRACLLNAPYLGARTLLDTSGLILIDELDLHLHPRWQRRIVGDLKRIFPNIQFFATTHSPQIIGEARPEEIVMLTPTGQKRPMGSYGMDSNWVLECVMEAEGRDPEIAKRINAMMDAIEDDRLDEAREMIAALRTDIGEAPAIVGAESYIWRIEHEADEAAE